MAIVLLSDFGTSDSYVGTMKGVIHKIAPQTPIIDLAHELPRFSILPAALAIEQAHRFFPEATIFIIVVDPGVGSTRIPLLVKTPHYSFIAPDNGVLSMVLEDIESPKLFHLDQKYYHLYPVSNTFHGRDIFAPVAAHLSRGIGVLKIGSPIQQYHRLPECFPEENDGVIKGRILNIDRFGNCITNLKRDFISARFPKLNFQIKFTDPNAEIIKNKITHYEQGSPEILSLLFDSSDFLEIALKQGAAAQKLAISIGAKFAIEFQ